MEENYSLIVKSIRPTNPIIDSYAESQLHLREHYSLILFRNR